MKSLFGVDLSQGAQWLISLAIILALIAVMWVLLRSFANGKIRLRGQNARGRQPRLGVVDIFDLDRQRQLVLIRRDNVEHLILVGGNSDTVIETNIQRGARAPMPAPVISESATELPVPAQALERPVEKLAEPARAEPKPAELIKPAEVTKAAPVITEARPLTPMSPPQAPSPAAAPIMTQTAPPPVPAADLDQMTRQLEEALKKPFAAIRPAMEASPATAPVVENAAPTKVDAKNGEPPKPVAPPPAMPKAEALKTEAPKAEAPKGEAPKVEASKAEVPRTEAPKADAQKAEPSKPGAPQPVAAPIPPAVAKPDAAAATISAQPAPAKVTEPAKVEPAKPETSKTEAPKAQPPKPEPPKSEPAVAAAAALGAAKGLTTDGAPILAPPPATAAPATPPAPVAPAAPASIDFDLENALAEALSLAPPTAAPTNVASGLDQPAKTSSPAMEVTLPAPSKDDAAPATGKPGEPDPFSLTSIEAEFARLLGRAPEPPAKG